MTREIEDPEIETAAAVIEDLLCLVSMRPRPRATIDGRSPLPLITAIRPRF